MLELVKQVVGYAVAIAMFTSSMYVLDYLLCFNCQPSFIQVGFICFAFVVASGTTYVLVDMVWEDLMHEE